MSRLGKKKRRHFTVLYGVQRDEGSCDNGDCSGLISCEQSSPVLRNTFVEYGVLVLLTAHMYPFSDRQTSDIRWI